MRWFVRTAVALLVLAAAWVANLHFGWLPRPTAAQRDALALLREAGPPLGNRNAFAAIWFLGRDVRPEDLDTRMREDIAAWQEASRIGKGGQFTTVAALNARAIATPDQDDGLCESWKPGCLAWVRSNHERAASTVARYGEFLGRVEALSAYDHVGYLFPPVPDMPFPVLGSMAPLLTTSVALQAVDGDHAGALARTCAFAGTWRRFRAHTDTLLVDMWSVAMSSAAAQLAAEIAADDPTVPWTAACRDAFAPLTDAEVAQCAQARWELRFLEGTSETMDAGLGGFSPVNTAHLLALAAPSYARHCSARSGDSRRVAPVGATRCSVLEHALDPFGCILAEPIELSSEYRDRVLDLDGRFAAVRSAVWLRDQPGPPAAAFELRPADLRTSEHDVAIDIDARTLSVRPLFRPRGEWTIPFGQR